MKITLVVVVIVAAAQAGTVEAASPMPPFESDANPGGPNKPFLGWAFGRWIHDDGTANSDPGVDWLAQAHQ
jgi:hypothetical protein